MFCWCLSVILLFLTFSFFSSASEECVWATGKLICHRNQSLVLNSVVELWEHDGPRQKWMNSIYKLIDADDKMGFTVVENEDGIFNVEGCGSDFDWIPGLKNSPEVYIGVHHFCKSPSGSFLKVLPPFRHFVPSTYHYHITSPIELD